MTALMCAAIVQSTLLFTGADATPADAPDTYEQAHRATVESGQPMVVMVGADWCGPCQTMKRTILPRVREHGLLRKVAFAIVNVDRERDLAQKLTGGGPVPQLVMFRKTADGWKRRILVGGQSVEAVEEFINEGLASDKAEKKAAANGEASRHG